MAEHEPVRRNAPAKLNLYLHVIGRRDDGYHLLDTLFAFCAVGDVIEAAPADALSLVVEGPFAASLSSGDDNLVLRAARAMSVRCDGRGARLRLIKNLPVAAGLGGGSADAAATLQALSALWQTPLDDVALTSLAAPLGADVPACLRGRVAFAGGIGEVLVDAPSLPRCGIVLCNPGKPLRTPDVFARRLGAFSTPQRFSPAGRDASELAAILRMRRNDLTPGAVSLAPDIAEVLVALERGAGCSLARMSGSGATCFGLFDDEAAAEAAAQVIAAAHPAWWCVATRICDR